LTLPVKGMTGDARLDEGIQQVIRESSTAFWEAFLRGDETAKKWLKDGDLKKRLGDRGVLEKK
jgi:hypothetical protein